MKTIFTVLFISSFLISAKTQDWVHQGSTWHYYSITTHGEGYTVYRYAQDTVVANISCHKILPTEYAVRNQLLPVDTFVKSPLYTYSKDDTTFFYFTTPGQWRPAYFWNSHVGDTLRFTNGPYSTPNDTFVKAIVDSSGTMLIDTTHLRFYTFHLIDICFAANHFGGKAIERIGMYQNDLTPFWNCITDDDYFSLRCYHDDSLDFNPGNTDCSYIYTYTGVNDWTPDRFSIYPNPAQSGFTANLGMQSRPYHLSISDISGRIIFDKIIETPSYFVSTAHLTDGIYIVSMSNDEGQLSAKKIAISRK